MGWSTVWVIGANVEEQLAPYDFNKDIPADPRLNVDVLDYMRAVFLGGVRCLCTVDSTGKIYLPWDESFPTYKGWVGSPPALPKGRRLESLPAKDIMSFDAWAKFFYTGMGYGMRFKLLSQTQELGDLTYRGFRVDGWIRIDDDDRIVEWVRIPQGIWESWSVGCHDGSGAMILKQDRTGELKYRTGRELPGTSYSAKKGEIDFSAMREEAMRGAAIAWDAHMALDAAIGRGANTPDQAVYKVLEAANIRDVYRFTIFPRQRTREEYINSLGDSEGKLYIWEYILDSRWYKPMCMPGHDPNNPVNDAEWRRRVDALWNGLPDDTLITLVSCKV